MKLSVKGYTCEIGSKQYNDKLAVRRAKAVARVLEEEGIHLSEVSGEGKCCYVSKELSKNRRSEVLVQQEGAAAAGIRCPDPPIMK
jgi:outer membrane protein OmpA-like peptidoglycan-associated protein